MSKFNVNLLNEVLNVKGKLKIINSCIIYYYCSLKYAFGFRIKCNIYHCTKIATNQQKVTIITFLHCGYNYFVSVDLTGLKFQIHRILNRR